MNWTEHCIASCKDRWFLDFLNPSEVPSNVTYQFDGPFCHLLGFNPSTSSTNVLRKDQKLVVTLPYSGHPIINVHTSLSKNSVSNLFSEGPMTETTLTHTVTSPGDMGNIVMFQNVSSNKLTLNTDNVEYLTIRLTDRYGEPLYGVTDYLVTFVIDFVFITNDTDNSVSLHEIRKRLKR